MIREPIVAGQFYPAAAQECARQLEGLLAAGSDEAGTNLRPIGALVPHAGWMCSGRIAGRVFRTLTYRRRPETVVLFGAVHRPKGRLAAVYDRGAWRTPLGPVGVDEELADALCGMPELFQRDPEAHCSEHSLEVQVPFVQRQFPGSRILPVMVPPSPLATRIGQSVGEVLRDRASGVLVVGTSDLTHYGPAYRFTPHGVGPDGLDWAKRVNDRLMLDRILALDEEGIVAEAAEHHNACGAGAIAAVVAATRKLGASHAVLLEHSTSRETLRGLLPHPSADAVGYAGVVFCD